MKPYLLRIITSLIALVIFVPTAWSADADTYDPSEGRWVQVEAKCMIPGPSTSAVSGVNYERIVGRYKKVQDYNYNHFLGTCLYAEPPCGNQTYSCSPATDIIDECISVESTGLIDDYDMQAYPCFWQSTGKWAEVTLNPEGMLDYCDSLGAGVTSMLCFQSSVLQLYEWQYYPGYYDPYSDLDYGLTCNHSISPTKGNPVNILNGNNFDNTEDLRFPSLHQNSFAFKRYYNSHSRAVSSLGYGWNHNFITSLDTE